ncbi:MAG: methylenetetrahydrofolate--tRNA-(uracil(54)-C(5))-methyltransferase (FADH(2)-oxidizing) TrmFO [Chitinivibrionales bacterium]|nr:methylenetetrahydrofolate--tRNA-(uracil(54)-C(5))-methyltransferase (FADH(2)-oxidizing) TrmFO [Chitinivibrionales bacterium]
MDNLLSTPVAVIGAGLAGSEAALVLASRGVPVTLYEMRPHTTTPAHRTDLPAELICSNSLKAKNLPVAHALLKEELRLLGSPLLDAAEQTAVPAGGALAVDRERFAHAVLQKLEQHSVTIVRQEIEAPSPGTPTIIAAGPLVSESLTGWLRERFSAAMLSFYDAIAPVVAADSIDMTKAFLAARREPDSSDYCNCPFTQEEYGRFYSALIEADTARKREFEEQRFFEACLPVEVIASRGEKSLAFGPLRPVGLIDPRTGKRPWAVCQLRKENSEGTSFGLVGFQTRLTIPEQKRVFRMIPGLENAEFLRFGSIHRNTYINAPTLLNPTLDFKDDPMLFCAGQLCGNEGYTESITTGHLAALFMIAKLTNRELPPPPRTTACGSLLYHITHCDKKDFTPVNVNYGILPDLPREGKKKIPKKEKRMTICKRALEDLKEWIVS